MPFSLPQVGDCAGAESAAIFGCLLISSYLFLFIGSVPFVVVQLSRTCRFGQLTINLVDCSFFRSTYKKANSARGGKDSKVVRNGKNGSAVVTEKK